MARARDSFGSALASIRSGLRDGVFAAGAPLVAIDVASALGVSITPVREALAHLAGEGLIEERRGWGYLTRRLDISELEDIYRLHSVYVNAAIDDTRLSSGRPSKPMGAELELCFDRPGALRDAIEMLFATIVCSAGNRPLIEAHRALVHRLAIVRLVEDSVLGDSMAEFSKLLVAVSCGNADTAKRAVSEYHERRLSVVGRITAALRARNQ